MEEKPAHKRLESGNSHSHGEAHVTWDEETIARHNLDRGTRMKIDEPDTPYHYYAESNDAASPARSLSGRESQPSIQWDELQSKLQDFKENTESKWNGSDEGCSSTTSGGLAFAARDEEGKKIEKDPHFAEMRKMHYNEFERVRAWKMQHEDEDEDEDHDEEEEEKHLADC
ncbi:protein phosphatase inhibitor ipp2 [Plasmopara halstedii]|uniref:Protein phosphatase inhibitor ipp2 n=1 Tax=Plasmopara halstedii TaxID=4781 RepID=A0A0P1ADE6_PLAHL|nr:protein phosphatase inhibitor ipp2 [Plasmopara halstedii]CEG38937.1 protein phosphatase inhibitor ipp2 [Plasmopara halstedii]|eukprot:XP_024575306.1 protein phosphatase inhibitor ipp2 [Plasmopara halstedii]